MKTSARLLLALLLHAGDTGAAVFQYIYIEANEGSSSGGHVAVQFGGEVFHYQYADGLIRLFKQNAEDFRFDYRFLQNRTLHVADIGVAEATYRRLYEHFQLRFFEQERQTKRLAAARKNHLLSEWLLRRISAENPATLGTPDAALQLQGAGLFFSDGDFAPVKKPQGACRTATAAATILPQLRLAIEKRYGNAFLQRRTAELMDAIRRLSPPLNTVELRSHLALAERSRSQPSASTPPFGIAQGKLSERLNSTILSPPLPQTGTPEPLYAFAEHYTDLLTALLALRVLHEARPLAADACVMLDAPEGRLDAREAETLQALQRRLLASSATLAVSKRPDWGYALLVNLARLVAIEQSLRSGRWVVADDFLPNSATITPAQYARHAAEMQNQRDDALADWRAARVHGARDEHGYSRIEMAANHYHAWLQGEKRQTVRYRGEQPLPVKSIRVPDLAFPELSAPQLRNAMLRQEEDIQRLTGRLESQYAYHLLSRNCVTEIFRTFDEALENATQQQLGDKIDARWHFIPFIAFAEVQDSYPILKTAELPAYRRLRLSAQYQKEFDAFVYARESNIFSATLYSPNPDDTWFVFFTDDALLLRPLFGAFNTLAALGQSAFGLLRWPFDDGNTLQNGARGLLMSLPELAFVNMRKGSYRYLSQRRLMPPGAPGH